MIFFLIRNIINPKGYDSIKDALLLDVQVT